MYDYGAIGVMYSSLHFAVMASVRYWLYRDRLRVPVKGMFAILASLTTASGLAWLVTGGVPGMAFDSYRLILALVMFAISCLIIKAPLAEHAFSYAFMLAGDAAVETTAFYVQTNFLPAGADYAYPLISALIMAAILVPAVKGLKRMIARIRALGSDRVWAWLDLACFSFLLMNLLVTLPHPADMSIFYPLGRYMMLLGMVGVYGASVRIMDALCGAADARAELTMTRRRVAMQQSYYDRMISQMDEVRRMRHDLRHHRAALSALIKAGDTASLSEYIDLSGAVEEPLPVTGNLAADGVLSYYLETAKAQGVCVESDLAIGRVSPIADPDLCVILGNLLENAVEAQKYVPPERRYVSVTAKGDKSSLTLAMDNRFDGTLRVENGAYVSRKADGGHGLGLASVKSICDKYGGVLQIETKGDMFMAGVAIGL